MALVQLPNGLWQDDQSGSLFLDQAGQQPAVGEDAGDTTSSATTSPYQGYIDQYSQYGTTPNTITPEEPEVAGPLWYDPPWINDNPEPTADPVAPTTTPTPTPTPTAPASGTTPVTDAVDTGVGADINGLVDSSQMDDDYWKGMVALKTATGAENYAALGPTIDGNTSLRYTGGTGSESTTQTESGSTVNNTENVNDVSTQIGTQNTSGASTDTGTTNSTAQTEGSQYTGGNETTTGTMTGSEYNLGQSFNDTALIGSTSDQGYTDRNVAQTGSQTDTGTQNVQTSQTGGSFDMGQQSTTGLTTGSQTNVGNQTDTSNVRGSQTDVGQQTATGTVASDVTNRTQVDDTMDFTGLLAGGAQQAQQDAAQRNATLSGMAAGPDAGYNYRMDQAINQALSGPNAVRAGTSAQDRVAARAAAEVAANDRQNQITAAAAIDPTMGTRATADSASAARQFAGETQTQTGQQVSQDFQDTVNQSYNDQTATNTRDSVDQQFSSEQTAQDTTTQNQGFTNQDTTQEASNVNQSFTNTNTAEQGSSYNQQDTQQNTTQAGTTTNEGYTSQDTTSNRAFDSQTFSDQLVTENQDFLKQNFSDQEIATFGQTFRDITKDATTEAEAWESLQGYTIGQMFGGSEGEQPEGGGGGKSIMCVTYWLLGDISDEILKGDFAYAKARIRDNTRRGYFFLTTRLAEFILAHGKDHFITKMFRPLVVGWSNEMSFRQTGIGRPNLWGKFLCTFGVPLCDLLGHLRVLLGHHEIMQTGAEEILLKAKHLDNTVMYWKYQNVLLNNLTAQKGEI